MGDPKLKMKKTLMIFNVEGYLKADSSSLKDWAEIHQDLLSQFSLPAEFSLGFCQLLMNIKLGRVTLQAINTRKY